MKSGAMFSSNYKNTTTSDDSIHLFIIKWMALKIKSKQRRSIIKIKINVNHTSVNHIAPG